MVTTATPGRGALLLEVADLDRLHAALRDAGYRVIGPTVRDERAVTPVRHIPYARSPLLRPAANRAYEQPRTPGRLPGEADKG